MEFLTETIEQEKAALLNFIAFRDANLVDDACRGLGTTDSLLMKVICSRTKDQIKAIDAHYRENYGTDGMSLTDLVTSECGGAYGSFMKFLTQTRGEFLYNRFVSATGGMMTNESLIAEIFCLSTHEELLELRSVYERRRDCSMIDKLNSLLSGHFKDAVLFLILDGKNTDDVEEEHAEHCAKELDNWFTKGCMMIGFRDKHRVKILTLLADESISVIARIKEIWAEKGYQNGKSIEAMVKDKFSGMIEETLLLLLMNPVDATCWKLKKAFDGLGCDDKVVARSLGGADKNVALQVAARFMEKYDKDLISELKDETSGNFCKALCQWLENPDPTLSAETDEEAIVNMKQQIAVLDAWLLGRADGMLSTDNKAVVNILSRRTKSQLDAIDLCYRDSHEGKTLHDFCRGALGGDFEEFAKYTQMGTAEFDCHIMMCAFSGIGCNKATVVEVLTTRHFYQIKEMREQYENKTDKSLVDRIRKEVGSSLKRLLLRLVNAPRGGDENFDAAAVAEQLYSAGEGRFGTNENMIIDIFTSHTLEQMKEVNDVYESQYSSSIQSAVEEEFSGHLKNALLGLVSDPTDTFCRNLKEAQSGFFGTNEQVINRIIGGNDKRSVKKIAARYFEKYDVVLDQQLTANLSGNYKRAVVTYITASDPTDGMEDARIDAEEELMLEEKRLEYEALAAAAAEELRLQMERAADEEAEEEAAEREAQRLADEEAARVAQEEAAAARQAAAEEAERQAQLQAEAMERARAENEALQARMEAYRVAEAERHAEALRQEQEHAAALEAYAAQQRAMYEQQEATRLAAEAAEAQEDDSSSSEEEDDDDNAVALAFQMGRMMGEMHAGMQASNKKKKKKKKMFGRRF